MIPNRTQFAGLILMMAASHGCIRREPATGNATSPVQTNASNKKADAKAADAATAPAAPTGLYGKVSGVDLLAGKGVLAFELFGQKERVKLTRIPVEAMPFKEAYRAQVLSTPTNNWDVQLTAKSPVSVQKNDVLLATLYFRTEWAPQESGEGESEFVFELAKDPYTKSATYPLHASRDWKKIHIPFVAGENFQAGDAQMVLRLGYAKEIVEFGGVTVENFGKQLALADLPTTKIIYKGMEPDAAWRTAADARIDKFRKAPLTVVVTDPSGKPLANADVKVSQTKQAFRFGTCVPAPRLLSSNPVDEQFRAKLTELFNAATLENDLKWVPLAGDWGKSFTTERAIEGIDWLRSKGFDVRGHVLVWPGWNNLPRSLKGLKDDPVKLKAAIEQHIRELTTKTQGKLAQWDVVNEPYDNHDLLDILGSEVMVEWFKTAHASDPQAQLFINDYAILSGGGGTTPHRDHYEKTIRMLLDKGAPLTGIGMQGHFGASLTAPEDLIQILDRFAQFKQPIWVTEYDVNLEDEALAGTYTRDFYTTLFSHPAVAGIVMWGFWDGSHWKNNAPLFRRDWSLKPAGEAFRELTQKRWRTDETVHTDAQGISSLRGFLGTYDIIVTVNGRTKSVKATLAEPGAKVTVSL